MHRAWLRFVRSVRRRALDFIRPRQSCLVAACHDSDTARRDRTQPPVNLPLAALPRRQSHLCSRLHRVQCNQRDIVITPITAFIDIQCRCGDLGGRYRGVPSARRPWATSTCDSLIISQSLQQLQKDEIPPLTSWLQRTRSRAHANRTDPNPSEGRSPCRWHSRAGVASCTMRVARSLAQRWELAK